MGLAENFEDLQIWQRSRVLINENILRHDSILFQVNHAFLSRAILSVALAVIK
jgi:hypothetical protein